MAITNPNEQTGQTPQSNRQLGTGFTNLQNIMQANTGNKLGQAVGGGIQQAGQQATNSLQSGVQDFNNQSQSNALGTQAQKEDVQNTLNNAGNVTDQNVTDFAKYRSGQYTGPTNINNISAIQNQASNAQQQGQAVGTAGGRQALLQQYAANPGSSYNSGQQNLDSLLLGATGGKQLQQARQSVSGLNNEVNAAQNTAQSKAQQLTNQAQGFGQQVTQQVGGAQANIYNPAQQQAQQANIGEQQAQTAEQAAAMAAQGGQLSADAIQQLGLSNGARTYGVNVGQFLGYNPANEQATAFNVMGQPQFQQYTGLQKLMGQTPQQAPQEAFKAGGTTYNQSGLQSAISSAQAPLNAAQTAMNQAQSDYTAALNGHGNDLGGIIAKQVSADRLAKAQQAYNNLNAQLSGSVSQVNAPTVSTIPGVS